MLYSIVYHRVGNFNRAITVKDFVDQIKYIKNKYYIGSIEDIGNVDNCVILTFDDGYKEHFNTVFPILQDNNIFGYFYPSYGIIGSNDILKVHKIHYVIDTYTLDYLLDYIIKARGVKYYICNKSKWNTNEIVFVKDVLFNRPDILEMLYSNNVGELYLNFDNMIEMCNSGMQFGCHGFFHDKLDLLPLHDKFSDINSSIIEMVRFGILPNSLSVSYPYGRYSEELINVVKYFGCKVGFTIEPRGFDKYCNMYKLPRIDAKEVYKFL